MSVATIIVSFNRLDLLKACLSAVLRQTRRSEEVIVFDNGSSEGTVEYIREEHPDVTLVESEQNLGGAGGFSRAIEIAILHGHELAWVMDDDSEPTPETLDRLTICFATSGEGRAGFVSPRVLQNDHAPLRSHAAEQIHATANHGLPKSVDSSSSFATPYATFVGALINLTVARQTFLPVEPFFIWWDDTEYTARLQRIAGGVHCPDAIMLHPYKQELRDLGGRLFYDLRNRLWVSRDSRLGSDFARERARSSFWRRLRRQAQNAQSKRTYARNVARGLAAGLLTRPSIRWPGMTMGEPNEITL